MIRKSLWINLAMVIAILILAGSPSMTARAAPASLPEAGSTLALAQSSGSTRIRFATGATSALVSGDLAANSSVRYVLGALVNQLMDVTLTAPQGVGLAVTTTSGRKVTAITSSSTSFRGYLPRSGDYAIEVKSGSQAVSYSVFVSIPERITFERGTTSATLKGTVKAHQSHDYILRAMAGQIMEINATPDNSLQLIIFGVDGTVLRSGMGEGSSFRGELPLNEDYIITVRAGDTDVSYTMNVIIPARISFARGAVSAALSSRVKAENSQYYVLRALKGQTMKVDVTSVKAVQLIIYGGGWHRSEERHG